MKRSIFLFIILLGIGIFFQYFLIETSPRILCSEIKEQLLKSIRILIYELGFLLLILLAICKFIFKETNINIVKKMALYIFIYFLVFTYLFYNYSSMCVDM